MCQLSGWKYRIFVGSTRTQPTWSGPAARIVLSTELNKNSRWPYGKELKIISDRPQIKAAKTVAGGGKSVIDGVKGGAMAIIQISGDTTSIEIQRAGEWVCEREVRCSRAWSAYAMKCFASSQRRMPLRIFGFEFVLRALSLISSHSRQSWKWSGAHETKRRDLCWVMHASLISKSDIAISPLLSPRDNLALWISAAAADGVFRVSTTALNWGRGKVVRRRGKLMPGGACSQDEKFCFAPREMEFQSAHAN